jgi:hypothetical protein
MTATVHKIQAKTHRVVVDIYADWRDEVAARDWEAVHVRGDRRQPVDIADKPKWWSGFRK